MQKEETRRIRHKGQGPMKTIELRYNKCTSGNEKEKT
jgi:hypothetical protein